MQSQFKQEYYHIYGCVSYSKLIDFIYKIRLYFSHSRIIKIGDYDVVLVFYGDYINSLQDGASKNLIEVVSLYFKPILNSFNLKYIHFFQQIFSIQIHTKQQPLAIFFYFDLLQIFKVSIYPPFHLIYFGILKFCPNYANLLDFSLFLFFFCTTKIYNYRMYYKGWVQSILFLIYRNSESENQNHCDYICFKFHVSNQ